MEGVAADYCSVACLWLGGQPGNIDIHWPGGSTSISRHLQPVYSATAG